MFYWEADFLQRTQICNGRYFNLSRDLANRSQSRKAPFAMTLRVPSFSHEVYRPRLDPSLSTATCRRWTSASSIARRTCNVWASGAAQSAVKRRVPSSFTTSSQILHRTRASLPAHLSLDISHATTVHGEQIVTFFQRSVA